MLRERCISMFKVMKEVPTPEQLHELFPFPENLRKVKEDRDAELKKIFTGEVDKFVLIVGPCSADNEDSVCEYVSRLAKVAEKVQDKIFIIPRIYTGKPRTNGSGYKGMLHQPDPDSAPDIFAGLSAIRKMQIRAVSESHLTAADEMLYPENYLYFADMLSYHAIGARSVENQLHRLVSSGVDAPVGMKNPTGGDLSVMINSIVAAQSDHVFQMNLSQVETTGNPLAHAILRGSVSKHGENRPNYHYEDLILTQALYEKSGAKNPSLIVDCNHANSNKLFYEQPRIAKEVLHSRNYNPSLRNLIKGFMIESYLEEGNQSPHDHVYGKSITDACLGWDATEKLIYEICETL